jgi:cobalt-zinc-cadmium efflux system protein
MNLGFTLIEFAGGFIAGSMSVLAGAVHDFGDCLGIGLAWAMQRLSTRGPSRRYHYGFGRLSVLSALISGTAMLAGSVLVAAETIPRLWTPSAPNAKWMLGLGGLGLLVNGAAALRLARGRSLNERMLQLHLLEDALGWAVVLVGSVAIYFKGWTWLDPILAVVLAVFIFWNAARRLRDVVRVLLQSVPEGFDTKEFRRALLGIPGVRGVHELKAWSVDGHRHVLSVHLELKAGLPPSASQEARRQVRELAADRGHFHVTVETEAPGEGCDP